MVGLLAGAEPFSHLGSDRGVLVLHGFTATPLTTRALAEACASAGYSVESPLLPGHGTSVDDLAATTWADWAAVAEASYDVVRARCAAVAVVGLSMGATLAVHLAETRRDVAAAVLINPLVRPPAADVLEGVAALLAADVTSVEGIGSDLKRDDVTELTYDTVPLVALRSFLDALEPIYGRLGQVSAPTLLFTSREDHVVTLLYPPRDDDVVTTDNGDALVEFVGGPLERHWLENSYHVATMDNDREYLERTTLDFLARTLA